MFGRHRLPACEAENVVLNLVSSLRSDLNRLYFGASLPRFKVLRCALAGLKDVVIAVVREVVTVQRANVLRYVFLTVLQVFDIRLQV